MATLPITIVNFAKEKAQQVVKVGDRGRVAVLVTEANAPNQGIFKLVEDSDMSKLPATMSQENKDFISRALIGSVNKPKYVIVVSYKDVLTGLAALENIKFDYLAVSPTEATETVVAWIKDMRDGKKIKVKAVLANLAAGHEGITNFTTDVEVGSKKYSAKDYTSRIAGLIAGCPADESVTYKVLPEVTNVQKFSKSELDTKINNGEFVLFSDGTKVKVGRGVNSLTTLTGDKTEDYKYIKLVDSMDIISSDIKSIAEDGYIGKFPNTYFNKLNLVNALDEYLKVLAREGIIQEDYKVDLDVDAIKAYLKGQGKDVNSMLEKDIKLANTGSNIFIIVKLTLINSIEDVSITITI